MEDWTVPPFDHLVRLAGRCGLFEHALLHRPRPAFGCCTDDAGRLLAVVSRWPADPAAERLAELALDFLTRAQRPDGTFRLRSAAGIWTGDPPSDDATGRALEGLGCAAARAPWPSVRDRALALFEAGAGFRSPHPRAVAHAALGAVEVLAVAQQHRDAAALAQAGVGLLAAAPAGGGWRWPAPRLTYSNALLPEAQMAVASAAGNRPAVEQALEVLRWLVGIESRGGRFSFTPVGGRGRDGPRPAFDQQPIEAWAMAGACARAYVITADEAWVQDTARAASWFHGANDLGTPMFDPVTNGGFDGLEATGVNRNQGAESTLAYLGSIGWMVDVAAKAAGAQPPVAASAASR